MVAVDDEVILSECDLYSYNSDLSCDPLDNQGAYGRLIISFTT